MRLFVVLLALGLVFAPLTVRAEGLSDSQKTEIEALVKQFILDNPKVVVESLDKFREQQAAAYLKEQADAAKAVHENVSGDGFPSIGPKDADITVVEFFDYNCGYCHKVLPELKELIEAEKNVRVIFLDFPILGPPSLEAAKWSPGCQ